MILIKTLFLNLIPEEVTVDAEAIVGLVTEVSSSRDVFQSNYALPAVNLHFAPHRAYSSRLHVAETPQVQTASSAAAE